MRKCSIELQPEERALRHQDSWSVCVECLFGKQNKPNLFKVTEPSSVPYSKVTEPSSVPYRTPSACAKMAAYPHPPPVILVPESIAQVQPSQVTVSWRVKDRDD